MKIPSREDCYRLIRRTEMPDHIVSHSLQVARVALLLLDALNETGAGLDRPLVRAAALLHDITKSRSLRTGEPHADTGAVLLRERGFPEVAEIVRQHVRLDIYDSGPPIAPAEVVNYADKRVLHDRVAPLTDRLGYILERYGTEPAARDRIRRIWKRTLDLEEKLFRPLPFAPEDVGLRFLREPPEAEKRAYRALRPDESPAPPTDRST